MSCRSKLRKFQRDDFSRGMKSSGIALLNILYLVHDLNDPATRRRVMMLEAGGARVTVGGFQRGEGEGGDNHISFGRTQDGNFKQRIAAVLKAAGAVRSLLGGVAKPDCIMARNLEMLLLARRAVGTFGDQNIPIVYECLDIHRLLLDDGAVGKSLRWLERRLAKRVSLLLTSSPAFLSQYFEPRNQCAAPALLLENRLIDLDSENAETIPARDLVAGPPWIIGWFGALRCSRSLEILTRLSRNMEGRVQVMMRGRPVLREMPNFREIVGKEPHLSFGGAYRNPEDMAAIYGEAHFSWAIDFFEEGQNSEWLLPNRLYEGCRFGAIPIALRRTEVGRYLERKGFGLLVDDASPEALAKELSAFSPDEYARQQARLSAVDPAAWVCTARDCRNLVERLGRLRSSPTSFEPSILGRSAV